MAEKIPMDYTDHFAFVMKAMSGKGILLTTWKGPNVANAMTIGWGMIGCVWGRPIWQVVVRLSRYTYELLGRERRFGVCVLPEGMDKTLQLCGTASGRSRDKLAECGLTAGPGLSGAPVIRESIIDYECDIVHANDVVPEAMVSDIRQGCYPSGDYHRIFWGQIIHARVDPAWQQKIK